MKTNLLLVTVSLLISLFIYLFYRTEATVVTQLFVALTSIEYYDSLRVMVEKNLELPSLFVYSLPEGLWVFVATIFSQNIVLKKNNLSINFIYAPLVFSIGLEILQLMHITHGKFDFLDIFVSFLFWFLAYIFSLEFKTEWKRFYFFTAYAIVYLSYVPN